MTVCTAKSPLNRISERSTELGVEQLHRGPASSRRRGRTLTLLHGNARRGKRRFIAAAGPAVAHPQSRPHNRTHNDPEDDPVEIEVVGTDAEIEHPVFDQRIGRGEENCEGKSKQGRHQPGGGNADPAQETGAHGASACAARACRAAAETEQERSSAPSCARNLQGFSPAGRVTTRAKRRVAAIAMPTDRTPVDSINGVTPATMITPAARVSGAPARDIVRDNAGCANSKRKNRGGNADLMTDEQPIGNEW